MSAEELTEMDESESHRWEIIFLFAKYAIISYPNMNLGLNRASLEHLFV